MDKHENPFFILFIKFFPYTAYAIINTLWKIVLKRRKRKKKTLTKDTELKFEKTIFASMVKLTYRQRKKVPGEKKKKQRDQKRVRIIDWKIKSQFAFSC